MAIIRQSSKIKGGRSQLRSHNEATGSLLAGLSDVDGAGLRQVGGDTQAPTAPVLTATAISTSQIDVSWTASTDNVGVASYTLQRSGDNVNWTTLYVGLNRAYNDTGLSSGATYNYRVKATDGVGNSSGYGADSAATFSPGTINILWAGDFETGDFLQWHYFDDPNRPAYSQIPDYGRPPRGPNETNNGLADSYYGDGSLLSLVTSPVRSGTYAAKFTVKNSINGSEPDDWDNGVERRRRTELTCQRMLPDYYNALPYLSTRWVSVSHFVPSDWDSVNGSGWGPLVLQIKPRNETNLSPCLGIELNNNGWRIYHRWDDAENPTKDQVVSQQVMYYDSTYPSSTDWPDGLVDFPDVAASQAALAYIGKGEWTDWIIHARFDARGSAQGGTGFIRLWKRVGSGPWVEVLHITPKVTTRGNLTFDHGIMYNSPASANDNGGFGIKNGMYMQTEMVWGLPNNRVIYSDNVRVGSAAATFEEMAALMT